VPSSERLAASAAPAPFASASSTPRTRSGAPVDDGRGHADGRPVLRTSSVLEVDAALRLRNADLHEHLARPECGLEGPCEERRRRDRPLAVGAVRDEVGVQCEQHRGEVRRGVAVRDGAADRAAVADLRVADELRRPREHGAGALQDGVGDQLRVSSQRADRDAVAVVADVAELVEPAEVDEHRRPRDPELHRRDERVPAGEQLRVLVASERLDRVVDGGGAVVLEGRRDHALALAAASTARTMLW
jgi:hypothetical protein